MIKELSTRQIEIIRASGKILMEKGILGLTTKNLATEMGFSESALYRHFKDKEAIVIHLINYLARDIEDRFQTILESGRSPDEILVALFKSQFSFFKANPHFIVVVLSDGFLDSSQEIRNEINKVMRINITAIKNTIYQAQEAKIFTSEADAEFLTHLTIGSFRLLMLQWKLGNFTFDIEKKGADMLKNLLRILKK